MVGENYADNRELGAELVCKALSTLNEEKGSTLRTIRNHITKKYKISPDVIKNLIIPSLEKGIQFGVIVHNMGRYQLSDLIDKIVDLARKQKRKKKQTKNDNRTRSPNRFFDNPKGKHIRKPHKVIRRSIINHYDCKDTNEEPIEEDYESDGSGSDYESSCDENPTCDPDSCCKRQNENVSTQNENQKLSIGP
ncbi:uncharacterized protein LOC123295643 [Chrysoperla carnea]|uniref:uncharacterized protein LOC123295643 n=1 Tax=Chrysoperla carnea TaxID=189513 RepID=UPI001D06377D|nr:uncharacterized protein LOC123295643 [Chrysoperla carnea]